MSLPTSRGTYSDCFDAYDKALEQSRGIRMRYPDYGHAYFMRMRLHMARKIIRKENGLIYEPGHAMHNCSIYDPISVKIRAGDEGSYWVYLEKFTLMDTQIEPITEPVPYLEYRPPLQITAQAGGDRVEAQLEVPVKRRV